jgi:hypothetical protein
MRSSHAAVAYDEASAQKQAAYVSYSRGEISLNELAAQVDEIRPPQKPPTWKRRIGQFLTALIAALIAPNARRDD